MDVEGIENQIEKTRVETVGLNGSMDGEKTATVIYLINT